MIDAEVIDRLWRQTEPTVFITRAEFERGMAQWDIEPVRIDGELAFAGLTRGPEFHFASFGTARPISRAMIWDRLNPILAEHGYVLTKTPIDGADRQHRLNQRMGFKVVGQDEFYLFYRLEQKCQS